MTGLSLNGPDALGGPERTRVGSSCADAPLGEGFLLDRLKGEFTLLAIDADPPDVAEVRGIPVALLSPFNRCRRSDRRFGRAISGRQTGRDLFDPTRSACRRSVGKRFGSKTSNKPF